MSELEFTCAHCGARMLVDEGTRRVLLDDGCAVCGVTPEAGAFEPTDRES